MSPELDPAARSLERRPDHRRGRASRLHDRVPPIERLEGRVVLSTDTWTGASATCGATPATGPTTRCRKNDDSLVFSALSGGSLDSINDLVPGSTFTSITITGSGYDLTGNAVNLTGGIAADYTDDASGTSTDSIDTTLGGGTVTVATGHVLR